MEIKLKGITKVFPGNPKKHIKDKWRSLVWRRRSY